MGGYKYEGHTNVLHAAAHSLQITHIVFVLVFYFSEGKRHVVGKKIILSLTIYIYIYSTCNHVSIHKFNTTYTMISECSYNQIYKHVCYSTKGSNNGEK